MNIKNRFLNMLTRTSIAKKIFGGSFIIILLTIGFGFLVLTQFNRVNEISRELSKAREISQAALDFNVENFHTQLEVWEYAYEPTEKRLKAFEKHDKKLTELMNKLSGLVEGEAKSIREDPEKMHSLIVNGEVQIREIANNLKKVRVDWKGLFVATGELQKAEGRNIDHSSKEYQLLLSKAKEKVVSNEELFDELKFNEKIDEFVFAQGKMVNDLELKQESIDSNIKIVIFIVLVVLIVLSTVFSLSISRSISKPIIELKHSAIEIANGNLETKINVTSKDEIGELADSYREMQSDLMEKAKITDRIAEGDLSSVLVVKNKKDRLALSINKIIDNYSILNAENEKQNWLKTGQNELNGKLRGELDVYQVARNSIIFIAKYLGAQIGTLYMYDKNSKELMLAGGYVFTKSEKLKDKIKEGEGLVGQAAIEKEIITVTKLPENYIRISSSLGDTSPRNIVVVPFTYNKELIGVIELGSVEEFSDETLEFLNIIREDIAIGISVAQSQSSLKELLEKTQQQAEELKTQQELLQSTNETLEIQREELKIANEELKQQAEKLQSSREVLKKQQEELRVSNEELEEQTQQLQLTGKKLKEQQEELQASNEELEEKTEYLERQKAEIMKKNEALKVAQYEIEKKAKALENISRYKSEFLANMSHELRTPLNSMLILSKDLADNKKGNLLDRQVESADIIYKSGTDLLELINGILDLSKIEAGKMMINIEQADLNDILTNINRNFNAQVTKKSLKLNLHLSEDLPKTIQTDQQRLEQIIKNLISNSIKFTKEGSITVDINRPGKDVRLFNSDLKPEKTIGISVIDTGIGIPEEKQSYIFEAFQQADGSTSRKFGGTGLGLSISRELAKLLGGELQLKSKEGEGSTFTLYIPEELSSEITSGEEEVGVSEKKGKSIIRDQMTLARKESISEKEIVKGDGSSVSKDFQHTVASINDDRDKLEKDDRIILMIEDDQAFARTIYKFCEERNFKFLHAGDGETGLKMVEQYMPDAIILDLHLPGIDGWKVLETLKENSHTRHIPVHMMSVEDQTIDAFTKGAMGYLTKPVSKNQLDEAFNKMESLYSKKIKNILVVEDDENMRKTIIGLVGENGVNVTTTGEGEKALSELQSKLYDCVILDLGLPDISGFEVLKKIGKMKDIDIPPIIVYTGKDLSREEEYELRKYAKSIIVKGVKSEERLLDETALFLHQVIDELPESKKKMISRLHDKEALFDGKKILVVDDDMRNVFALSKILEDKNMNVSSASNGEKALELLEKNPDIDLILMDIMMPVMDGYETMRQIRTKDKINNIPIIALTAKAMKEDRDKCIEAGANDYLTKPIDIEKLISLMRVWLYN